MIKHSLCTYKCSLSYFLFPCCKISNLIVQTQTTTDYISGSNVLVSKSDTRGSAVKAQQIKDFLT